MLILSASVFCDSHRTDEPELPKFFCDMISVWMFEHGVKSLDLSLDEVPDDEE